MEEIKNIDTAAPHGSVASERLNAFIDIFYPLGVAWLYIESLIAPLFGIVVGIILLNAGRTPQAKRVGKICLILGIINICLWLIFLVIMIITGITEMSRIFAPRI